MTIVTPQRNVDVCTTDVLDVTVRFIVLVSARVGVAKICSNSWNFRRGYLTYGVYGGDINHRSFATWCRHKHGALFII
jgi:hypothetical protein